MKRYWMGTVRDRDDFGLEIKDTFYDGVVANTSSWAIMTPTSFLMYGCGRTGTGVAQKYERQKDGRWLKVEG
jgi:hypothetical protein